MEKVILVIEISIFALENLTMHRTKAISLSVSLFITVSASIFLYNLYQRSIDYSDKVALPKNWIDLDTTFSDYNVRIIYPDSPGLLGNPRINVVTVPMEGRTTDDFVNKNIFTLEKNNPTVDVTDNGVFKASQTNAIWFSYTIAQHKALRELVNYIIPHKNYACMITCGVDEGYMSEYRSMFDSLATSVKMD